MNSFLQEIVNRGLNLRKIIERFQKELTDNFQQVNKILEYEKKQKYQKGNFVYFAFFNEELIYIGKTSNLNARLTNGHYSGRRSGSQFCVYFFDKYILPKVCSKECNVYQFCSKEIEIENIDARMKEIISSVKFYYCNINLDKCGLNLTQLENQLINFALDNYKSSILNKKSKF